MANNAWYTEIEDKLYNVVKTRIVKALRTRATPITGVHYTNENASDAPAAFPTWYFHELQPAEMGNDLENVTINAVLDTIEIVVFDSDRSRGKIIMNESVAQMKNLAYSVTMMPIVLRIDNVYQITARFRRMIGADDFENM